ncbi:hypothetical protein M378DRAFT_163771 [Amanita muscaria Koide BX008]|uniref:Secreted protein n=1 Tax=Amanita muscaria (strain Koide BX008) TaxID=946122 RepID=A0A0C2X5Q2_AMAMK|nr:hypothetical protein M378DRAFT_163771 [Amanita muscaria Koide BX008]
MRCLVIAILATTYSTASWSLHCTKISNSKRSNKKKREHHCISAIQAVIGFWPCVWRAVSKKQLLAHCPYRFDRLPAQVTIVDVSLWQDARVLCSVLLRTAAETRRFLGRFVIFLMAQIKRRKKFIRYPLTMLKNGCRLVQIDVGSMFLYNKRTKALAYHFVSSCAVTQPFPLAWPINAMNLAKCRNGNRFDRSG